MIDLMNLMDAQTVKNAKAMGTVTLSPIKAKEPTAPMSTLQPKVLQPTINPDPTVKEVTRHAPKAPTNLQPTSAQDKPLLLAIKPEASQLPPTPQLQAAPIVPLQHTVQTDQTKSVGTVQGEDITVEQTNQQADDVVKNAETLRELKALQETVRLQVSNMKYLLETIEGLEEDVERLKKEEPLD